MCQLPRRQLQVRLQSRAVRGAPGRVPLRLGVRLRERGIGLRLPLIDTAHAKASRDKRKGPRKAALYSPSP